MPHAITISDQPTPQGASLIPLTRGLFAIVDVDDFDWLNQWKWHAMGDERAGFYAARAAYSNNRRRIVRMHRLLLGAGPEVVVDHANGITLDNRRHNLRVASNSENSANRRAPLGRSDFKGVRFTRGRWQARICVGGTNRSLGCAATAEEAARLYDHGARKFFGAFAVVNFPVDGERRA